ncbi:diguanylate phosphodiesterase [Sphingomonas sp. Leaf339]|uniref:EAL domain-containing protein n=1 Tax=Sphingomonas sp. Leaf339 TaxID=1736343 RepID=UPI0006F5517E|nr:EAL domain-containing protein [Sphingomonas sp. Leaf339]KQU55644.1 diguanylate phosphodiesterase [Sphingomonas sp. Leaf339]
MPSDVCHGCRTSSPLPFDITMAFQPIFDIRTGSVFAYEALVRGVGGQSAGDVMAGVGPDMIYKFDQTCRVNAIELAGRLFAPDDDAKLSINFMPNAVYEPDACIRASLAAAHRVGFDPGRLMFEFTEDERMQNVPHVRRIIEAYRARGFTTAIDDFGAGYAGLGLLADLEPDMLKLDMALIRSIDTSSARRTIVAGVVQIADALGVKCIAEGIETAAELQTLREIGIRLCQGYLLARPAIGALPQAFLPD